MRAQLLSYCLRRRFAQFSAITPWSRKVSSQVRKMAEIPISVTQFCATEDKAANFSICADLVRRSVADKAKVVFLPEGFDYIQTSKEASIASSESLDGETITAYRKLAKELDVWLFLGGFHERAGNGKISNAHVVIDPDGDLRAVYRKIHLFDVDIPEKNVRLMESSYVIPGKELVEPIFTPAGRVGLAICYDMRFPEMASKLRHLGAEIITYPSAFTVTTGEAHWETLLRARAIETQCFVVAAAQVGQHNKKRSSYGHALVVDPWGKILADLKADDTTPKYQVVPIDLTQVDSVRRSMPVLDHRASAVYDLREPSFRFPEDDSVLYDFGQVKVPGSTVFLKSRYSFAFVNKKCVRPGHVLVSPIRKAVRFADLTQDEVSDLFALVKRVETVMEDIHQARSSTISVQDGADAGQTIWHFHVHVIPRTPMDFPENDNIYKELAEHDKGPNIAWREHDEMEAESRTIRDTISRLYPINSSG